MNEAFEEAASALPRVGLGQMVMTGWWPAVAVCIVNSQ
jgi:hypothetical protein